MREWSRAARASYNDRRHSISTLAGDKLKIIAKPYIYYGNDQLSDFLSAELVSSGNPTCDPIEVDVARFGDYCTPAAEQVEHKLVKINCLTVTKVFNIAPDKDEDPLADADVGSVFGFKWSWGNGVHGFDDMSYIAMDCSGVCFEVQDPSGNKMLVEDDCSVEIAVLNCALILPFSSHRPPQYFQNYMTLLTGEGTDAPVLAVGDTYDSIEGYINSYYGSYKTDAGGQYRIQPKVQGLIGRNSGKECPVVEKGIASGGIGDDLDAGAV